MFKLSRTLICIVLLCSIQAAVASDLLPYKAIYKTQLNGMKVNVTRRVQLRDSQISISVHAKKFLFGLREDAVLVHNGNGVLMPASYEHKRRGLSRKHDKELAFDWSNDTVRDLLKPNRAPLPVVSPTYDKLSYQLQMSLDLLREPESARLEYCVTNGVRNRVYTLDRVGEEMLDTPLGKLRTIKWERTGDDDDRQVLVWVASDWQFLLVRLDQNKERGGRVEQLMLQSAKIDGKSVQGVQ
jgi:hypothetical protein